jgi:hypothetical protein
MLRKRACDLCYSKKVSSPSHTTMCPSSSYTSSPMLTPETHRSPVTGLIKTSPATGVDIITSSAPSTGCRLTSGAPSPGRKTICRRLDMPNLCVYSQDRE